MLPETPIQATDEEERKSVDGKEMKEEKDKK